MGQKRSRRRHAEHELDLAEHAERLKAIPEGAREAMRRILVWVAAAVLLCALGWMAMGR